MTLTADAVHTPKIWWPISADTSVACQTMLSINVALSGRSFKVDNACNVFMGGDDSQSSCVYCALCKQTETADAQVICFTILLHIFSTSVSPGEKGTC